ncbi:MAG: hydroxymethylpyrimidine/phosphomethylpyrimidine kinase [Candidatus Thiodiazotropha sp. 6PLUC2]
MQTESNYRPVVLAIGGHDPGGGAGIQADIESIGTNGCHAATALTCVTVQDSCNVDQLIPLPAETLSAQCSAVLEDCRVEAIKIGLLGSTHAVEAVIKVLQNHPKIPIVFDPVLSAGGGNDLTSQTLLSIIQQRLLPLCDLITPNTEEAARLSGRGDAASIDQHAETLLQLGAQSVLITGTHDLSDSELVTNRLYQRKKAPVLSTWPRLSGEYHGSGCTLAAALAAHIGFGDSIEAATQKALTYSWDCLNSGFRTGKCQSLPNRWHHSHNRPEPQ